MKHSLTVALVCSLSLLLFAGCGGPMQSAKSFSWSYPPESAPGEGLVEVSAVADGVSGVVALDLATPVAATHIECALVVGNVVPPGQPVHTYDKHVTHGAFGFGFNAPDGEGVELVSAKLVFGSLVQCSFYVASALAESIVAAIKPPIPPPAPASSAAPSQFPDLAELFEADGTRSDLEVARRRARFARRAHYAELEAFGDPDAQ